MQLVSILTLDEVDDLIRSKFDEDRRLQFHPVKMKIKNNELHVEMEEN